MPLDLFFDIREVAHSDGSLGSATRRIFPMRKWLQPPSLAEIHLASNNDFCNSLSAISAINCA
jgi:hypothetical protein